MAVTVSSIQTNFNSYIGDSSTDRISAAERLQYMTEATVWLQESLENDLQNATYPLNYYDTVHRYKVNTSIADLLEGADLRRAEREHDITFTHKSAREIAEEIGQEATEPSWSVERYDGNKYLLINYQPKYRAKTISNFDSTSAGGGTWELDATNGDGTNLETDTVEYKQGNASLKFDADVSQSVNNKVILSNTTMDSLDLSEYEDLAAFLLWVYIPETTNFSSITLYWGSSTSAYWSATVTTDMDGSAFTDGWNRIRVNWSDASMTSSPDVTAIDYFQIDLNYTGSYVDDTNFRVDELLLARPEKLTFHYIGWYVGTDTSGTDITAFSATTDIPYFSGQYDQYRYAVAHKAASLAFADLRLSEESEDHQEEAARILERAKMIIPSSKNPESKSFKVRGINLTRRRRGSRSVRF
jgi:hypothetical protein